jgi:hypothetical protein
MTRSKPDPTTLIVLAAVALAGLLVARRYGLVHGLRTVNRALGIARVLRRTRPPAARIARKQAARRVRPRAIVFSKPG